MARKLTVCVYCGSSAGTRPEYATAARALGRALGERGWELVYGGGRVGLMGAVADATLAAGGTVVGIIPEHIRALEVEHTGLNALVVVDSMHSRKRQMVDRADAFVILPGGFGTLDETFEVLTWKQLHLHDKPIFLADVAGFWDPLIALLDHTVNQGFVRLDSRALIHQVADIPAVMAALDGLATA